MCFQTFRVLAKANKALLSKVMAMSGNMVEPDLGMRQEDLDILFEHVSIVFHTAATVKFDEALK